MRAKTRVKKGGFPGSHGIDSREDKHLEAEVEPGYSRTESMVLRGMVLGHSCLVVGAGGTEHRAVNSSLKIFPKSCHFGGMVQEDFPCVHTAMLLIIGFWEAQATQLV